MHSIVQTHNRAKITLCMLYESFFLYLIVLLDKQASD